MVLQRMQLSLTTKVNSALQTSLECATLAKNGCTVHSTIWSSVLTGCGTTRPNRHCQKMSCAFRKSYSDILVVQPSAHRERGGSAEAQGCRLIDWLAFTLAGCGSERREPPRFIFRGKAGAPRVDFVQGRPCDGRRPYRH